MNASGQIPVGKSMSPTPETATPRRKGSFSFRMSRKSSKSSTTSPHNSMKSFSFDDDSKSVDSRQNISISPTTSKESFKRNPLKTKTTAKMKEKEVMDEMDLECER